MSMRFRKFPDGTAGPFLALDAALTGAALAIAMLASAPLLAATGTKIDASAQRRSALLKACPEASRHWAAMHQLSGFDGAVDDSADTDSLAKVDVQRSKAGFDVGFGLSYGELFLHVAVPACTSVGYGWHAEYAGGMHIPAAVHPSIVRNGERVTWAALNESEKQDLLRLMQATVKSSLDHSIAGILWRRQHASAAPQAIPATTPPSAPHLLDASAVDYTTGRPHEERRAFIECPMSSHTYDEPADGFLFLGSRLVDAKTVNGMSFSRMSLGPAAGFGWVGRVYGPQPWLVVYDSKADRTIFVPDNGGGLIVGGVIYAAGTTTAVTVVSANGERAVILGGTQGCDARLLDLERLRSYALPGRCPFYDSGTDFALLRGDGAGRVVWFKSDNSQGSPSGGVVIDYTKLLHSEATEGIEIVAPEKTLAWGSTHNDLDVILTGLLLASDKAAQDEALAALKALAGWETPSFPLVGVRAAAVAAVSKRPPTAVKGYDNYFEIQAARPYWLIGSLGGVTYLLVGRGETPKNTLELELADGVAIVTVPKSDTFASESLSRIKQLLDAMIQREFYFGEAGEHYSDYSTALLQVLMKRPLTPREKSRACAVEKELLVGHGGWEFGEIIDTWCEEFWRSAASDVGEEHQARLRPVSKVCAEWKAMCRRAGGAPSAGGK